ncbi:MAG: TraB/GumN family protein [Desulfobulbaceae bacterium]|jgi:pheromone shutdown-related protein TraB|nr:TraB/GumN family protein [Desulfobulbaceae bacterium]
MTAIPFPSKEYPEDVAVINLKDKTVLLVGTAHISHQSTDLVREVIEQEKPDTVCIELDEKRYLALSRKQQWDNLDLKQIIRDKQLSTLLVNLILASYQKKLGGQLGIMPGTELLTAARTAEKTGSAMILCDRDVRVTLRRAWHATSLWKKMYLLASIITSLFDRTEIDEEKLAELRRKDVLSELMSEIGAVIPDTKRVLIDERDIYMAEMIKKSPGSRLVAVVGAGHMEGILRVISENNRGRLGEINTIPPVNKSWKTVGWAIPVLIILSLFLIGIREGAGAAGANVAYWILANGIPSAIGAMIAFAHPATIVSAFAAAPITSLTPVIGAGYVTAFVQVMAAPPVVREFESVSTDIASFRGWWCNKLLRIFMVFLLTGLGSAIGTWIGGYKIFSTLFS